MMRYFVIAYIVLTVLLCLLCSGCSSVYTVRTPGSEPVQWITTPWGQGGRDCSRSPENC